MLVYLCPDKRVGHNIHNHGLWCSSKLVDGVCTHAKEKTFGCGRKPIQSKCGRKPKSNTLEKCNKCRDRFVCWTERIGVN